MALFSINKIFGKSSNSEPQSKEIDLASIKSTDIVVMGSGCKKCHTLADNAKEALQNLGLNNEVIYLTDFAQIASFGVMTTPALMINNKVLSTGKVLSVKDLQELIPNNLPQDN